MGWKSFLIVVKPVASFDPQVLLKGLGYGHYVPVAEAAMDRAIYPADDICYLGQYEDCLLICDVILSSSCLSEKISEGEAFLMQQFPQAQIGAFVLQSTVNFWGYAVLADGQKIRARGGSGDDGTFLDHGAPLKQELLLLEQSTLDADGQRIYHLESFPDEPMTEDQMGEDFVFDLSARFFEVRLDMLDDDFFMTTMQGYQDPAKLPKPGSHPPKPASNPSGSAQPSPAPKPWWKFW